ncbi:spore germination protein [Bacillus taeanensis]|uniref:Spore germination protein n=1 Tax=Bacillus taeanensis TaxID=273032 RepID=A0A366XS86_9BACI|nr:spore germination protein [Bacillus taeanensis]RBW68992.1 spore germination protein [Bacillus taeanensis]
MPSIVGAVNIVSAGGVINFGDSFYVAPFSTSKTYAGSGSFNTGNIVETYNRYSATNVNDPDLVDNSNVANI